MLQFEFEKEVLKEICPSHRVKRCAGAIVVMEACD